MQVTRRDFSAPPAAGPRRAGLQYLPVQFGLAAAVWIALAIRQGYDFDWDILNYHFYNGFALIHGRTFTNMQPAMLQSYFAPTMDAGFYVLAHLLRPTFVVVILATCQSLALPLLFRLSQELLCDHVRSGVWLTSIALLLTLLGAAAPASIWQAGSPRGDTTTAVLVVAALLCVTQALVNSQGSISPRRAAFAGALVGLAVGLKLTNAPFAFGLLAALLVPLSSMESGAARRVSVRGVAACLFGMSAAFLASYGWWGLSLYQHFGNPVFPNFNQLFHSPYAAPVSYADPVFAVPTWQARLLFPFVRNSIFEPMDPAGLFDLRMAFAVPLCAIGFSVGSWRGAEKGAGTGRHLAGLALLVFVLISYLGWLLVFRVNRYLVAVDLVAPLACSVAVAVAWRGRLAIGALAVILAVILPASAYHTRHLYWLPGDHRHGREGGYFGVSLNAPPGLDNGVVAMLGDRPTTFVIPFFPSNTMFVRLQGSLFYPVPGFKELNEKSSAATRRAVFGNAMSAAICRRLDETKAGLFVLRLLPRDTPHDQAALAYYGLKYDATTCQPVRNKSAMLIDLCPAIRTADPECSSSDSTERG